MARYRVCDDRVAHSCTTGQKRPSALAGGIAHDCRRPKPADFLAPWVAGGFISENFNNALLVKILDNDRLPVWHVRFARVCVSSAFGHDLFPFVFEVFEIAQGYRDSARCRRALRHTGPHERVADPGGNNGAANLEDLLGRLLGRKRHALYTAHEPREFLFRDHDLAALWQDGCEGFDKLLRDCVLRALAFDKLFESFCNNALVFLGKLIICEYRRERS